jgi:hypothetical protein
MIKGTQAYKFLQVALILLPLVAGLDKFFHIFAPWPGYLSPMALQMLGGHENGFMMIVGLIEIVVAIGLMFKPKVFAYIVSLWLYQLS